MRILATSDLHFPHHMRRTEKIYNAARTVKFDVFVIAGDIADGDPQHYRIALSILGRLSQPKLAVFGNHDLWVEPDKGDSLQQFEILSPIFENFGFSVLDIAPAIIDDVGFVGNVGWYDYSFRRENPDFTRWVLVIRRDGSVCRWDELTEKDYATKQLTYIDARSSSSQPGNPHMIAKTQWLDHRFINWRYNDKEFAKICVDRIKSDIKRIRKSVKEIVCVTHHVPFPQLVLVKDEPGWDFNNAFIGSRIFGETLLQFPEVKTVICGHTHHHGRIEVGHIFCCNVSSSAGGALFLIDTETRLCSRVFPD